MRSTFIDHIFFNAFGRGRIFVWFNPLIFNNIVHDKLNINNLHFIFFFFCVYICFKIQQKCIIIPLRNIQCFKMYLQKQYNNLLLFILVANFYWFSNGVVTDCIVHRYRDRWDIFRFKGFSFKKIRDHVVLCIKYKWKYV